MADGSSQARVLLWMCSIRKGNAVALTRARGGTVVEAKDAAEVLAMPHPTPASTPAGSAARPQQPRVRRKPRLVDDDIPVGDSEPTAAEVGAHSHWTTSCHVLAGVRTTAHLLSFAEGTAVDAAVQDEAHHVVSFLHNMAGGDNTLTAHHIVYMVSLDRRRTPCV
jgi:hypothetical protein